MFANGPGDRGSIISKTQKMVLDGSWLNTQHYKAQIKGMWSNSGKGVVPSPTPVIVAIEKGAFGLPFDQLMCKKHLPLNNLQGLIFD